ncbi:hypothetical protein FZI91_21815 [Mycobacterium sp. CBMA271]|uniref:hypothetical protein n=1 Tax=unclassified Mycobacteroides TaxID=2618759 RepID=UPI0012DC8748|nr:MULTISPECIES: hypothetical protein [unclassified Mycobacteroides]MUM24321.1 hypothetical protein [Mycobacteroides sp. CBMA 271]
MALALAGAIVLAGCHGPTSTIDGAPVAVGAPSEGPREANDSAVVSRFRQDIWPPVADVVYTSKFQTPDTPAFNAIVSKDLDALGVDLLRIKLMPMRASEPGSTNVVNESAPGLVTVTVGEQHSDRAVLLACYSITGDWLLESGRQKVTTMKVATFELQKSDNWYLRDVDVDDSKSDAFPGPPATDCNKDKA